MIALGALLGAAAALCVYFFYPDVFTTATAVLLVFVCGFAGVIIAFLLGELAR